MPTDYIPSREADKVVWLLNIESKIDTFLVPLGITAAEATAIKARCSDIRTQISAYEAARTAANQAKEAKDFAIKTDEGVLRNAIQSWKLKATFTDAVAAALGLTAPQSRMNNDEYKTQLTTQTFPGRVTINFTKKGVDGVNVYARLKGQSDFIKLAFDSHSPYEDNRPLSVAGVPETREYMAMGVIKDEEIGQQSDIVEVVFGG
jgi:hypothetical protein